MSAADDEVRGSEDSAADGVGDQPTKVAPDGAAHLSDVDEEGALDEQGGVEPSDAEERRGERVVGSAALADPAALVSAVEAILFVVEAPVAPAAIAAAIQQPVPEVVAAIEELRRGYDERRAGIELRDVAGGVRIYTRPDFAPQVELFLQEGQRSRLTQAALETLAVIAYRQPVTRSRVSAIRGVNVDGVVRTLTTRGLIVEVGPDPETGGGLFRTTDLFVEKMGLQSLDQLPSLAPLLPDLDGLDSDEL